MKEEIIRLYNEGNSYREIVKILGCSRSNISYHCHSISRWQPKITPELVLLINSKYQEGLSIAQIGRDLELHSVTITGYINNKREAPKFSIEKRIARVNNYTKNVKQQCVDYKGGCCSICGYNKSINSLQFHHTDPTKKEFGISGGTKSFDKQKPELDKCILVCANCHGEIHEREGIKRKTKHIS